MVVLFLSPMRMVRDLCKSKDATKTAEMVFIITACNCLFWTVYSYRDFDVFIFSCNVYGLAIQTFYFLTFAYIKYSKTKWKVVVVYVVSLSVLGLLFVIACFIPNDINGWGASIFNTIMNATPMQKLIKVCRTYQYSLIPFDVNLFLLAVAITWFIYGVCVANIFVIIPNVCGIIMCTTTIILNIIYKKKYNAKYGQSVITTEKEDDPKKEKEIYVVEDEEEGDKNQVGEVTSPPNAI